MRASARALATLFGYAAFWVGLVTAAKAKGRPEELCGRDGFHGEANYTFNSNAWNPDDSGWTCIYLPRDNSSNAFTAEWRWQSSPPRVHAYPHISLDSVHLPLRLSNLSALTLDLSWSMKPASLIEGLSDDPTLQPNADALSAIGIEANVVMDLFVDIDAKRSQTPAKQQYEIMVWLGKFGEASQPIGMDKSGQLDIIETVGGTDFILYNGTNGNGQTVFSWVAASNLTTFAGDITPLVHSLPRYGLLPWETHLGIIQFGSETFFAAENVKFIVKRFSADLQTPTMTENGAPVNTDIIDLPDSTETSPAERLVVPLDLSWRPLMLVGIVSVVLPAIGGLLVF